MGSVLSQRPSPVSALSVAFEIFPESWLERTIHATRAVAFLLALRHARRDREHIPIALFLGWVAFADLARHVINRGALAGISRPYSGWPRVLGHLESALFVSWHFGLAALARRVFGRRSIWPVAALYVVTIASLILSYPTLRGANLARAYTAIEYVCLATSLAALISWGWRKEAPTLTHACGAVFILVELANLAGPYRLGLFESWSLALKVYIVLYFCLILIQVVPPWFLARHESQK
jgi:hypothetical protein